MEILTDYEISNASNIIDKSLFKMTKENRGETSTNILNAVRSLNDHIAFKIWKDIEPNQAMDINKVASKLLQKPYPYKYIGIFDKYLRKSLSHFTPNEDGAERLLIKYYRYIIELKKIMRKDYNIEIIKNSKLFLTDIDTQTQDYYNKVAIEISNLKEKKVNSSDFDNYYVNKITPFFVNDAVYFEVVLEPAEEKPNKFNRITAFTDKDIMKNYSVALSFVDSYIDNFNTKFPIKIITSWSVSIRPCELNNFAELLRLNTNIQRSNVDYKSLMEVMTAEHIDLLDIIDFDNNAYSKLKHNIESKLKSSSSKIFLILDYVREISKKNTDGKNIFRYLMCSMNNRLIKLQRPFNINKQWRNFYLDPKCFPFEKNPYCFNPKGHNANIEDLLISIDTNDRQGEIISRLIYNNSVKNNTLYSKVDDFFQFGNIDEIKRIIENYNNNLYEGFKPNSLICFFEDNLYLYEIENDTVAIIKLLISLSNESCYINELFTKNKVLELKNLPILTDRMDDPQKEKILINFFKNKNVNLIFGAAGTGKTTLINHISYLTRKKRKVFLAKTNPAVENLRRKVDLYGGDGLFITIDKFINNIVYSMTDFDLFVVDECSTVENKEILEILKMAGSAAIVLVGDIYQIESIGFGNWFNIASKLVPEKCKHELTTPYRSTKENLKCLWKEVRELNKDNEVMETLVRSQFSNIVDRSIFDKKSDDEIVLCLNYNGLYGLNNINKLMQLGNNNKFVKLGIWEFRIGDPILFNDSNRFSVLHNNLKGKIIEFTDTLTKVTFTIELFTVLSKKEIESCNNLKFICGTNNSTTVSFEVFRRKAYYSDDDNLDNAHILPFQLSYAVSIHKAQGLEYKSVKIVICDDSEEKITHNILYTAITRAKEHLTIYWSPEVCNRVLDRLKKINVSNDYITLNRKYNLI